jgi:hypothetical protein
MSSEVVIIIGSFLALGIASIIQKLNSTPIFYDEDIKMLTIFAIPKAFSDPRISLIQQNAIQSWLALPESCEIILFGNDPGTAEVAAEFGLQHIPQVKCNEHGTPLLNSLFETAQTVGHHDLMAYVNADIILMSDLVSAIRRIPMSSFLMVGQRWDLDVDEAINFKEAHLEKKLRDRVNKGGILHGPTGIDYFVFQRGLWKDIPPFAIGRTYWDNWLIYRARFLRVPVIDATQAVMVVHQNHGFVHPQGKEGLWQGPEAQANIKLTNNYAYTFTLTDTDWILTTSSLQRPQMTLLRLRRQLRTLPILSPHTSWWANPLNIVLDFIHYKTLGGYFSHPSSVSLF